MKAATATRVYNVTYWVTGAVVRNRYALFVLVLLVVLTLMSCSGMPKSPYPVIAVPHDTTTAAPAALPVVDYSTPPRVTGTWPTSCHARGALPDAACTPGSIAPRARNEVCMSGFELTKRPSGTDAAKTKAMVAYGVPTADRSRTELDHLVPLSLGGSNDVTNLWPELSDIPNAGFRNSKDAVERRVLTAVCRAAKPVPLDKAQLAMAHDWTTALRELGLT